MAAKPKRGNWRLTPGTTGQRRHPPNEFPGRAGKQASPPWAITHSPLPAQAGRPFYFTGEPNDVPELIDTAWIAQRMACRRDYVTDRVTKRPDFPRPVINITQKMRRWSREDVEAWIAGKGMPNVEVTGRPGLPGLSG